jgi:2-polyprenyl-6-hydroxyphenyl methylase/3-demethylubiquinone-9 3-methyltransferase
MIQTHDRFGISGMRRGYSLIDNELYEREGAGWWEPCSALYLLDACVNPARVGYFKSILSLHPLPERGEVLEIGCGGGILCEEIARLGFAVTGIDPAEPSLRAAAEHARKGGLLIRYEKGAGEALSFPDSFFDAVLCCDVLEHVACPGEVISEAARVLKPDGIFFYDTINRTFTSRVLGIWIAQKWKWWAFMPPRLHAWEMFIRPAEIKAILAENGLEWVEHRGTAPNVPYRRVLDTLRRRASGELTYDDLAARLRLVESPNLRVMYMGYAVKAGTRH